MKTTLLTIFTMLAALTAAAGDPLRPPLRVSHNDMARTTSIWAGGWMENGPEFLAEAEVRDTGVVERPKFVKLDFLTAPRMTSLRDGCPDRGCQVLAQVDDQQMELELSRWFFHHDRGTATDAITVLVDLPAFRQLASAKSVTLTIGKESFPIPAADRAPMVLLAKVLQSDDDLRAFLRSAPANP